MLKQCGAANGPLKSNLVLLRFVWLVSVICLEHRLLRDLINHTNNVYTPIMGIDFLLNDSEVLRF